MNTEFKSLMVSIVAVLAAGGFAAFNHTEIAQTNEVIDMVDSNKGTNDAILMDEISKLKTQVAQKVPAKFDDSLLIEANNKQGEAIYKLQNDLNITRTQLQVIANKMLVVEALQNKVSQAKPQGVEMFSLVLLKSDGNYVPSGEFLQSETVYISGKYDGPANKFDVMFKKSGQLVLERTGLNMPTDGVFSYYFNLDHGQPVGQYTVTVAINGKLDTISFEIL